MLETSIIMDDAAKLKKRLLELFKQFDKQDNPVILRDISLTAYKLMTNEKAAIVCCPTCNEVGQITTYNWPIGNSMQVYQPTSTMKCENRHKFDHKWAVGDRFVFWEPVKQFYVYRCEDITNPNAIQFKKVNGERYFPEGERRWNKDTMSYEN
jgi:hypothetical protein